MKIPNVVLLKEIKLLRKERDLFKERLRKEIKSHKETFELNNKMLKFLQELADKGLIMNTRKGEDSNEK